MATNHFTKLPVQWKIVNILLCISLAGCAAINIQSSPQISPTAVQPTSEPIIPGTDALVTFQVTLPEPLPAGDSLFLVVLDEVTGLALNPQRYIMEAEDETHFFAILPFVMDSMVTYRYQRQGSTLAQEHLPDGRPVRYRLYHVEGPGIVEDTVSRWTDSSYDQQSGELRGQVIDAVNGKPLASIMVAAGGYQVYTSADGTFLMKQLPSGTHNVVALSLNGAYQSYQQGALIQPGASTDAQIAILPSTLVTATFTVQIPDGTPEEAPIRLAGNFYQLGNSFADLAGGSSSIVSRMPILNKQEDGIYRVSLSLPVGADLRYKYTLGDGLWNAERTNKGAFTLRQIIVPDADFVIEDRIETWSYGPKGGIHFETLVPPVTSSFESVFIQFDPGFGWSEPIPMWGRPIENGSTTWNYLLSSPLDMVTTLRYRFCLEGNCNAVGSFGVSDSAVLEKAVEVSEQSQTVTDHISLWNGIAETTVPAIIPNVPVLPRGENFVAGVAILENYQLPMATKFHRAISDIKNLHANWIFFTPSWSYTNYTPQVLEFIPISNPGWNDLENWVNQAHLLGLNVALIPVPRYSQFLEDASILEINEWEVWFENYKRMVLHYTLLASETNVESLVIGEKWVTPFSPQAGLPSLTFDTSQYWRELMVEIRAIYSGKIFWGDTYPEVTKNPPALFELVDGIYVLWSQPLASEPGSTSRQMRDVALQLIDGNLAPLYQATLKPIILALAYPSNSMGEQMDAYNAMMMAVNERDWLQGIVSTGYYPSLPLQDQSTSVHGKPASGVLWYWFPFFLGQ